MSSMRQERISLTREELKRYTVVKQVMDQILTTKEAAQLLGVSSRQVFRLKNKVIQKGEEGVIHCNRGRQPAHALSNQLKEKVVSFLTSETYHNCNDYHLADLLTQYEGIDISPSTVRRIRQGAQIKPKKKRRRQQAHRPRERRPQAGALIQMDASPHRWLEDRAEPMSLHAAIDDATGKIVAAVFRSQEDLKGYFMITQQLIEQEGIPMSLYSDRHSIFKSRNETQTVEQELAGEPVPLTQFGEALKELGITHTKAMTPQAKGRVERLFQTLQDRWVIELRIRNINTIEEANQILPALIDHHNQQFEVEPRESESAFVPLGEGQSLERILCYREKRTLGSGETIAFQGKTYKIQTTEHKQMIPAKTRVDIRWTLNGALFLKYKGVYYPLKETRKPRPQWPSKKEKAGCEKKSHKPAGHHPWRQYNISRVPQQT